MLYGMLKGIRGKDGYFLCLFEVYISVWITLWKMCKTLKIKGLRG